MELEAQDINYIYILTAMDIEDLLESVTYYVKVGNIKSRSTVDIYYAVLGKFYKFISEEYKWKNEYFLNNEKINIFKAAYEKKILELGLLKSQQEPVISDIVARDILNHCNEIINDINLISVRKKGIYSNYISAIIVKLVLLYG